MAGETTPRGETDLSVELTPSCPGDRTAQIQPMGDPATERSDEPWDRGHFDNDSACDLLADMGSNFSPDVGDAALQACLVSTDDYLEAPEGQKGIAAAALVRLLLAGDGSAEVGGRSLAFDGAQVDPQRSHGLRRAATEALNRILDRNSEIRELWEESPQFPDWLLDVERLRDELAGDG